jgi:hypothetical protein
MRGDSYQLQGQAGGVLIATGNQLAGRFRRLLVLAAGSFDIRYPNISNSNNESPIFINTGTLTAGMVLNGLFEYIEVIDVGAKAICYYE